MRRVLVTVALLLVACSDEEPRALPDGGDLDRCLAAATALRGLEPATDLAALADSAALIAATARTAGVDDDELAAGLRDLDDAATAFLEATRARDIGAATAADRELDAAYAAIDAAAEGMETAECRRSSWGAGLIGVRVSG